MFARIQKLLDRIESRIALWHIISGGGVLSVGGISAWLASAAQWLDQYGAIAWWFAGLLGALAATALALLFSWARFAWVRAGAMQKWKERVDTFNPLSTEFNKLRIQLRDLVNPADGRIKNKTFTDCELLGPAVIHFYKNNNIIGPSFINCDFIAVREKVYVNNIIAFENVTMVNGTVFNCTVYIPLSQVQQFTEMGITFITPIEDSQTDNPPQEDIEPETQP